jgi:hypothetical protein
VTVTDKANRHCFANSTCSLLGFGDACCCSLGVFGKRMLALIDGERLRVISAGFVSAHYYP